MKKEVFEGLKYVAISGLAEEMENSSVDYRFDVLSIMHALNKFLDYDMYNEYLLILDKVDIYNDTNKNIDKIRDKIITSLNKVQINDKSCKEEMISIINKFLDPNMYPTYVKILDNFSYSKRLTKK